MHSFRRPLLFLTAWLTFSLAAFSRDFDLRRDTFAFSNDTVMRYGLDEQGRLHISRRDRPVEYGHRCFVLARAVMRPPRARRESPRQEAPA